MEWEELKKLILAIKKKRDKEKRLRIFKSLGKNIKYPSSIIFNLSKKR
jgi:hypothetical protein